jgi:hypothetical protein
VRTDVLKEHIVNIIRVKGISELGTAVPSSLICLTVMMEATRSSKMSVLKTATWHHISEDGIFHSHRHENFKSYLSSFQFTQFKKGIYEKQPLNQFYFFMLLKKADTKGLQANINIS